MLTFELGGIACGMRCPEAIQADLARRYAGYETERAPEIVCDVKLGEHFAPQPAAVTYPAAHVTAEGTRYQIQRSDMEARFDLESGALHVRSNNASYVVESSLRIAVSLLLPWRGGLLLHSSGVVESGRGYVFSGRSGAGKTTMVRLLSPRRPLGDDLLALLPSTGGDDGFRVIATPFAGEYGVVAPRQAPLERLHFIEQAPDDALIPISVVEARTRILRNTLAYVRDVETAQRLQDVSARLASVVPAVRLRFAHDERVAKTIFSSP